MTGDQQRALAPSYADELKHFSIDECAAFAGFSRRFIEKQMERGLLRFVQVGSRRRIAAPELRRWLNSKARGAHAPGMQEENVDGGMSNAGGGDAR